MKDSLTRLASVLLIALGIQAWSARGAAEYVLTEVYPLRSAYVFPLGINQNGEIVGYAMGGGQFTNVAEHGFVHSESTIIDFAALVGWPITQGKAINSSGQVAGECGVVVDGDMVGQALLYSAGQITPFGSSGARGNAINDLGQIVGRSANRAFLYSGGNLLDLGTFGGSSSEARGINNSGQIVGFSTTTNDEWHAFLYSGGRMRDLGTLGGRSSDAFAINEHGQIVGRSSTPDGENHSFFWFEGGMADLGTLGGGSSTALSINARGQIVGTSVTADGKAHAFVYFSGRMVDLNTLITPGSGWELVKANGINDAGQIVGTGDNASGSPVAGYLLTPLPVLSNPVLSNGTFQVSVATVPNQTYFLEYSETLDVAKWTALAPFRGDGTVQLLSETAAAGSQRFYRLRMR